MAELLFQYYELWNSSSVADRDASTLELTREHKSWGKSFQFSSRMYISSLTCNKQFGLNIFGMSVQWRAKRESGNNCIQRSWLKFLLTGNQRNGGAAELWWKEIIIFFHTSIFQLTVSNCWSLLCLWKPFMHS